MGMKFQQGTPDTLHLVLLPLKAVGARIDADMQAAGNCKCCGVCSKSFSNARKWRSIARLSFGGDAVVMVAWKLCGTCTREAARNGGKVPERLRLEAEAVCKAVRLLVVEPKGTA